MKKWIVLVLALACVLGMVGCDQTKKESIEFPFETQDVLNIEMYRFPGEGGSAEKKTVTNKGDITALYTSFVKLSLTNEEVEETAEAQITSFRFNLSDGTSYDLIYRGYDIKEGTLESKAGDFAYFTVADIGGHWDRLLSTELEATVVDISEMPQ